MSNTASITGPDSAIYGVGPTVSPVYEPASARVARAIRNSDFATDVRNAFASEAAYDGGTYGVSEDLRYVVGGFADSVVLRADATPHGAFASALTYAESNPSAGLGWWIDTDTGRVWLDAVHGYASVSDAYAAAIRNGEISIFDSQSGQPISVASIRFEVAL